MDVVIISCGKTDLHRQLTQNAINTCLNSDGQFRIIIVETCDKEFKYSNAETYHFIHKDRFNYNRALNYGVNLCTDKYVACCNNDLIFYKDWSDSIIHVLDNYADSVCPFDRGYHLNYRECKQHKLKEGNHIYMNNQVRVFFVGWCFVIKRETWNKIGRFSEDVEFYYSDNIVVEQYKKHGVKHALVANSFVDHYQGGEKTWRKVLCPSQQRYYTDGQQRLFNQAKINLWSS